eukprot:gene5400-26487_t
MTNKDDGEIPDSACKTRALWVKGKCVKHLLPISLVLAVIIGYAWPTPGNALAIKLPRNANCSEVTCRSPVQYTCVIVIFIISGLKLSVICIGTSLTRLITFPDIEDFGSGLVVFFSMPTTVSSGVVLTQQANGNYALALLLTVITNTTAVFTIPPMLKWLAKFTSEVELDVGALIAKLAMTVLAPLVFGKLCRGIPGVPEFVKKYKWGLKVVSIYALVALPWMKTSVASEQDKFDGVTFRSLMAVIGWALTVHLLFLAVNFTVTTLLRMPLAEKKAVVICASQKTLPIAITVLGFLPADVGDGGLMGIGCIIAHLSQIVIDSWLIGMIPGWADADAADAADAADVEGNAGELDAAVDEGTAVAAGAAAVAADGRVKGGSSTKVVSMAGSALRGVTAVV